MMKKLMNHNRPCLCSYGRNKRKKGMGTANPFYSTTLNTVSLG